MNWKQVAARAAKAAGWTLLAVFVFLLTVSLIPYKWHVYVEAGWVLLAGWVTVVNRSIEGMTVRWPAVAMAIVCFAGLWLGLTLMLRRRTTEIHAARARAGRPWGTALAISLGLLVMMVVGTAVAGAWQHTTWLLESDRPLVVKQRHFLETKVLAENIDLYIRIGLNDHDGRIEPALDTAVRMFAADYQNQPWALAHQIYYVASAEPSRFSLQVVSPGSVTGPQYHLLLDAESKGHQLQPPQAAAWLQRHRNELRLIWPAYLPPAPAPIDPPAS